MFQIILTLSSPGGGHSSLVLVRTCRREIWKWTWIQIPIFQEKVTHSYTNWLNFGPNFWAKSPDFFKILKFEPILAQIWENFEKKSTHSYTKFCVLQRVIHLPRGWFCYPCWRHVPVGSFVSTEYPPPSGSSSQVDKTDGLLNSSQMLQMKKYISSMPLP